MPRRKKEVEAGVVHYSDNTIRVIDQVLTKRKTNHDFSPVTLRFMNVMVEKLKRQNVPLTAERLRDTAITYGMIDYGIESYVEVIHSDMGTIKEFQYFLESLSSEENTE